MCLMNWFPARATNSLVRFATVLLCTALPVESAAPPVPPIGTAHEPPPPPKSPADSCAAIRIRDGLSVSLAVAEPLVVSPVAIDWGADGKLWVAEMRDYPMGGDGKFAPGGTIRLLEDTDGDGRYDKATVFLDGLPFPTGVTAWGRGVLICAAPDILFAEDTNGDGRADVVKKWFTGFLTDNYQARVNSLALGLDNWIHGANGLLGGTIRGSAGATATSARSTKRHGRTASAWLPVCASTAHSGTRQVSRARSARCLGNQPVDARDAQSFAALF